MNHLQWDWEQGCSKVQPNAYIKDASSHWWDGYNGEEVVIIDDLDKYHVKLGYYLKVWGDHYPFPAQIKGGQMMARPKKIIITSNYHPREIWTDSQTVEPIARRFKIIERNADGYREPPAPETFNFVFPPSPEEVSENQRRLSRESSLAHLPDRPPSTEDVPELEEIPAEDYNMMAAWDIFLNQSQ